MQYKNYYQILGVERDAKQDEIKRAYRKLARKYHPDVSKEADAEARFKEVTEAYEVLGDPEKRVAYDQLGNNWKHGQDFRPPPNWDANFEFSGGDSSFGSHGNFSDFFEQIFGGGRFGFARDEFGTHGFTRGSRGGQQRPQEAEDYHAKITIDLEDSFHGANRNITLQTPVVTKEGHVTTKPHVLNVKIPRGICEGQRIRLKGQGAMGDDGKRGDLILEIVFNPHKVYRVNGRDLEMDVPIAPWEAALGETIRVPTLAGNVEMKIPANSQSDQKLRLKGRGLPGKTSNENGNLVCVLKIVLPSSTHAKAKALYEQMRRDIPFNPREAFEVK